MAVLHRYDYDDVYFRSISIGLVNLLNDKLHIWHRKSDTEYVDVIIPFFYDHAGDERFIQDISLKDAIDECKPLFRSEGLYERVPRGHVKLSSANIDVSKLSNRFIRGEFREETNNGQLITYNAPINHIPLNLNFEIKIIMDGELHALKIWQRLIETFYKVHTYSFLWGGFVIKANVGFPESHDLNKSPETTYGQDKNLEIQFSLEAESYLPVIDPELKFRKDERIEGFHAPINPDRFKTKYKYAFDMETLHHPNVTEEGNLHLKEKYNMENVKYIPSDSNKIIR